MHTSFLDHIKFRSFGLTIIALVIGCLVIFKLLEDKIINTLTPELEKKAMILGATTLSPIYRAISLGIPYDKLRGIEDHFEEIKNDNKEIRYLAFLNPKGEILSLIGSNTEDVKKNIQNHEKSKSQDSYSFGHFRNTKTPLIINNEYFGSIHLGVDPDIIAQNLSDISYDALTVLFISLLVTFEFILFVLNYRINGPIRNLQELLKESLNGKFGVALFPHSRDEIGKFVQSYKSLLKKVSDSYHDLKDKFTIFEIVNQENKQKIGQIKKLVDDIETNYTFMPKGPVKMSYNLSINAIRIPLFIFVFAESLSISFLPIFSSYLYEPFWGLPRELVIVLPIVFFMAIYALTQPISGVWLNYFTKRSIFVTSGLCTTVGLMGAASAESISTFILWRMLTAVGYGAVLLTAQGYILDLTTNRDRGKGMSIYISAFYSGSVCGSAIGSILADNLGFRSTFFISGIFAIISAMFLWFYIRDTPELRPVRQFATKKILMKIFKNPRFMALTFLIALPSRVISVSYIYYIVPVYLSTDLGSSQSAIGRVIMVYGFMIFLISPFAGQLNDQFKKPKVLIALGAFTSGISCLPLFFNDNIFGVTVTVTLLGIAHGFLFTIPVANCAALVPEETKEVGAPMIASIFRFLDFQGYFIGTVIASSLVSGFGYKNTMLILAGAILILGLVFYFLTPAWNKKAIE